MPSSVGGFDLGATRMRGQRTSVAALPLYLDNPIAPSSGAGVAKYAVSAPQADLLRELAAVSDPVRIPPGRTQVAWALEQRGLIKRTWRGSGHVAVVTADGRYYLKHGKHPRQVQAEKERLAGDSACCARPGRMGQNWSPVCNRHQGRSRLLILRLGPGGGGGPPITTRSTTGTFRKVTRCGGTVANVATVSSRWSTKRPRKLHSLLRYRASTYRKFWIDLTLSSVRRVKPWAARRARSTRAAERRPSHCMCRVRLPTAPYGSCTRY